MIANDFDVFLTRRDVVTILGLVCIEGPKGQPHIRIHGGTLLFIPTTAVQTAESRRQKYCQHRYEFMKVQNEAKARRMRLNALHAELSEEVDEKQKKAEDSERKMKIAQEELEELIEVIEIEAYEERRSGVSLGCK